MNDAGLEERLTLTTAKRFGTDVRRRVYPIACHGIATCAAILSMALIELILTSTLGHDVKLYELIPVRHVIHTIDLVMFARFLISVWRELR